MSVFCFLGGECSRVFFVALGGFRLVLSGTGLVEWLESVWEAYRVRGFLAYNSIGGYSYVFYSLVLALVLIPFLYLFSVVICALF